MAGEVTSNKLEEVSIFEKRTLRDIYDEIKGVYLADKRPWIIGYSGGKDSTTVLQLIWHAVSELPEEKRTKTIYVVCNDTLVETPVIVDYINHTLAAINNASETQEMPFTTHKTQPEVEDTFWVNLIGKGYPAPQTNFRWCTDRMKIKPADKFILETVSKHGEVILALGVRRSESMTRAQLMSLYEIKGSLLSRHTSLPGAYVYAPIKDFTINDVWTYLLQNKSPWGSNNRDLVALYQNAQGECPLVVDDTTPSCGNSRFGCWVCTVVQNDKSMKAMIDNGQEWMESLLEFRDELAKTQDPATKHKYRELKRRMGYVSFKTEDDKSGKKQVAKKVEIARGPYKLEYCIDFLRKLLRTQKIVRANGPDPSINLISTEELFEIRRIWRTQRGDWEDSVPRIYKEETGEDLSLSPDDIGTFGVRESQILQQLASQYGIEPRMITKLIDVELQSQGMSRRASVLSKLEKVLSEEWRSEDEVLKEKRKQISREI